MSKPWILLSLVAVMTALGFDPADDAAPNADPSAAEASDSLDDELLKGLTDNEEEDAPSEDAEPADAGGEPDEGEPDAVDDKLRENLGEGEDIGDEGEPLTDIGRRMREVQRLISKSEAGESTQELQRDIVTDLKELIKQALQQQQQSQSSQSSSKNKQKSAGRKTVKQPKPGTEPGKTSEQAARDSEERLRKDELKRPDMNAMNELAKRIWGHLPDKDQRDEMLQSSMEQFLPEYEQLISEYFRALAERQSEK